MNLNQIKNDIKNWENSFFEKNQRRPNLTDFKSAPLEIKEKYKLYKNEKQNKTKIDKNIIDPWSITFDKNKKVVSDEKENHCFEENIKKNIKNMLKQKNIKNKNGDKNKSQNNENQFNHGKMEKQSVLLTSSLKKDTNDNLNHKIDEETKILNNKNEITNNYCNTESTEVTKLNKENTYSKDTLSAEQSVFLNCINRKRKLPEKQVTLSKPTFLEKASKIDIDSLLNPKMKANVTFSPWENEFNNNLKNLELKTNIKQIDNEDQIKCTKVISDHTKNENVKEILDRDYSGPVAKKIKIDTTKQYKSKPDTNFVKLNMKFKSFCGKATSKQKAVRNEIKRSKWNNKLSSFRKCYNCGEEGHFSNKCSKRKIYGPRDEKSEVKALGFNNLDGVVSVSDFRLQNLDNVTKLFSRESYFEEIQPEIVINSAISNDDLEECLEKSLKIFGFSTFKTNQEKVIRRICSGKSTLAVMPTGSGKSLCYQIPAYIFQQIKGSIALIISPLISLMQDQILKLPSEVKGVALNSTLKFDAKMKILEEINKLQYAFVLISPEALVESNWLSPDKLPPISFVCIDEVHCLSDWSHHFRPSYLRVCKLLRERYSVNCFLGLSATCTSDTIDNVMKYMKLDKTLDSECCVRNIPIPDNITISVSESEDKEYSLIKLLQKEPISTSSSILIYCSTREETNEIATLISVKLQKHEVIVGKKKLLWTVDAYHAGLTLPKRSMLQRKFMKGKIRVLVATVAFGMGLDKSDLRTVIHFSRPRSFENFVQEIGRAGRDGEPSYAHVLMVNKESFKDGEDEELNDLHRHTYANHVEPLVIKQFIRSIFTTVKKCEKGSCRGHVQGIRPSEVAVNLNIREETLMTLLCYLELFEQITSIKILPANYRYLKLNCYRGPKQMCEVSQKSVALSTVLTVKYLNKEIDLINTKSITVDMIELWEKCGLEVPTLRKELKALEWSTTTDREGNVKYFRSGVGNEFTDWHWIIAVRCDLDDEMFDEIYKHLYTRLYRLENNSINDMDLLHSLLRLNSTALPNLYVEELTEELSKKSTNIRDGIIEYFNGNGRERDGVKGDVTTYSKSNELQVRNNIRAFITQFKSDNTMTARAVASVLHGINCPIFPSIYWASHKKYWKSALNIDFLTVMRWANEELRYLL